LLFHNVVLFKYTKIVKRELRALIFRIDGEYIAYGSSADLPHHNAQTMVGIEYTSRSAYEAKPGTVGAIGILLQPRVDIARSKPPTSTAASQMDARSEASLGRIE
jgi:hypothetical protein